MDDMCEHMKYIRSLVGIDCIGLGSAEEIEKVFYKNVLRVFRQVME